MKNILMSLFIVSISPLLIQCSYPNNVDIQNDMDFDIKAYSRSNEAYNYFVNDNPDDSGESLEGNYPNYIIIKSGQIRGFFSRRSSGAYSTDRMYELLADYDDNGMDFYIENMDTNEIILTRENLRNNPLATLVKSGKGEFILILDEYE